MWHQVTTWYCMSSLGDWNEQDARGSIGEKNRVIDPYKAKEVGQALFFKERIFNLFGLVYTDHLKQWPHRHWPEVMPRPYWITSRFVFSKCAWVEGASLPLAFLYDFISILLQLTPHTNPSGESWRSMDSTCAVISPGCVYWVQLERPKLWCSGPSLHCTPLSGWARPPRRRLQCAQTVSSVVSVGTVKWDMIETVGPSCTSTVSSVHL